NAGIPYQSFGERPGALALTIAWTRLAMARSEVSISAIFASKALASSSLLAADFRSLTSSFIAARSSSVSTLPFLLVAVLLLAVFCLAFVGLLETSSASRRLLRVWLIAALCAVTDPPDVAVGVRERTTVPAPLKLRRGLEDLGAGLLRLVHHLVDSLLTANDVVHHHAGEAAALRIHADIGREAFAPVEAHKRPPVRHEEHRDLVVVLDLPAEALRVEALRFLHVIDAQKDRADVRIHFASPQYLLKP